MNGSRPDRKDTQRKASVEQPKTRAISIAAERRRRVVIYVRVFVVVSVHSFKCTEDERRERVNSPCRCRVRDC